MCYWVLPKTRQLARSFWSGSFCWTPRLIPPTYLHPISIITTVPWTTLWTTTLTTTTLTSTVSTNSWRMPCLMSSTSSNRGGGVEFSMPNEESLTLTLTLTLNSLSSNSSYSQSNCDLKLMQALEREGYYPSSSSLLTLNLIIWEIISYTTYIIIYKYIL